METTVTTSISMDGIAREEKLLFNDLNLAKVGVYKAKNELRNKGFDVSMNVALPFGLIAFRDNMKITMTIN